MNEKDYVKLINEIYNKQYDSFSDIIPEDCNSFDDVFKHNEYKAAQELSQKELTEKIKNLNEIKIGDLVFKMKIITTTYTKAGNVEDCVEVNIYQFNNKMLKRLNVKNDIRFNNSSNDYSKYFDKNNIGKMSFEIYEEMVNWIQVAVNIVPFL